MGTLDQPENIFQHMPDAVLTQATPVQNTWYTILPTTYGPTRILHISVEVDTTGETLQVQLTIDGQVINTGTTVCALGAYYAAFLIGQNDSSTGPYFTIQNVSSVLVLAGAGILEGRSIKVEMRKTTANGVGTLHGRVMYQQLT